METYNGEITMLKKIYKLLLVSTSTLISVTLPFGERASALEPLQSCESIRRILSPKIGTPCVERVFIESGKADWPNGRQSNTEEYTPPKNWLITYVSPLRKTNGQQSNASRKIVSAGQVSKVSRQIDNLYKESLESYNKIKSEATVPVKGVPVKMKQLLENIENRLSEIREAKSYVSNVDSNTDQVILTATAWGRCKWRVPFSSRCGDGTGGWYKGYIDVTRVYTGNINNLEKQIKQDIAKAYQFSSQEIKKHQQEIPKPVEPKSNQTQPEVEKKEDDYHYDW